MHIQAGFQGFIGPTPYGNCSHLYISGQMLPFSANSTWILVKERHQTDTDGVHLQNWAELMLRAIFCSIHHTMTWGHSITRWTRRGK